MSDTDKMREVVNDIPVTMEIFQRQVETFGSLIMGLEEVIKAAGIWNEEAFEKGRLQGLQWIEQTWANQVTSAVEEAAEDPMVKLWAKIKTFTDE